jgi:hypothetical protein
MGRAEGAASLVGDLHGLAMQGAAAIGYVTGENPRVAGGGALGRLPVDADFIHRMACKRAMRSSVDGCVENRRISDCPVKGLMMNMWAVEGVASMGIRCDQVSSFCKPLMSG